MLVPSVPGTRSYAEVSPGGKSLTVACKYDTEVLVRPREPAENDDAWRGSAIASLDKEIAQTQDLLEVRSDVTRPTSALAPLPSTPRPVASP